MTSDGVTKILERLANFLNKNEGNTLNEWLSIPLLSTIRADLEKLVAEDEKDRKELVKTMPPKIVSRKEGEQPPRPIPSEGKIEVK